MRSFLAFLVVATALGGAFVVGRGAGLGGSDDELKGLWTRWPEAGKREEAPVAFYYFHSDGIGLFRFGKIGYNTTNSYNWSTENGTIVLSYRKTGEVVRLPYRIERGSPNVLVVGDDSHNPGVAVSRYTFVPFEQSANTAPDLFDEERPTQLENPRSPDRIDNRLWMDLKKYATGGMGFALYQLREAGIDGRGTGWHHVGDFDDWSTEALSYRVNRTASGRELDLLFTLRNERRTTPLLTGHRTKDGADVRFLTLQQDPRGFWAAHAFDDAGPSFGAFVVDGVRPSAR
ncbi:MAG: hypothetical protein Q8O67_19920 [Deltaproteobacteria bacterium]|nr:hypothetical protein [Deltaproteobacteria bacterium]